LEGTNNRKESKKKSGKEKRADTILKLAAHSHRRKGRKEAPKKEGEREEQKREEERKNGISKSVIP